MTADNQMDRIEAKLDYLISEVGDV
jgi:hypothetical protein